MGIAGPPGGQGRSARGLLPAQIAGGVSRAQRAKLVFFVETGPRSDRPTTEVGIDLKLLTPQESLALILSGEFVLQLHIGALLLAGVHDHLDLVTL